MSKKKQSGLKKKVYNFKINSLGTHRYKTQQALAINVDQVDLKEFPKPVSKKYKPSTKKIGKNYIELMPISEIEPMVFRVSPTFKTYTVSSRMLKIAKIMKKAPIAGLRRIGYDIEDP